MSLLSKNLLASSELVERCCGDSRFMSSFEEFQLLLNQSVADGKNIFSCGNGGSYCDATHFAEELTGRFKKDRKPIGCMVLGEPAHTTCVGNDYGFEHIFSRQLSGLGRPGDLLLAISTSGNSKNVIEAIKEAHIKKIKTVALLGGDGGVIAGMVDVPVIVPSQSTERTQEIHIKIIHSVIEGMERSLFPENYT